MFMTVLISVLVVILLIHSMLNRTAMRRCNEDIDEIRSSLFELRRNARSKQAEINRRLAEIRVLILRSHGKIPENRVPFTITADCIACGTCVPECPVNAIADGDIYEIDPETCIACKKCADVCPVHACIPMTGPSKS